MNDHFDRAPGAGRARHHPVDPGFLGDSGDGDAKPALFNQREPLRQPRTSPPFSENNISPSGDMMSGDCKRQSKPQYNMPNASTTSLSNDVSSLVMSSKLSASAPEFIPSAFTLSDDAASYDDSEIYYPDPTLADMVTDFLDHLSSSPGSFDSDVEYITSMLNAFVTTEDLLEELVELIYTQSTAIPNFSYTGARLCNYLSHHLTISPPGGNFRQLLLKRCQKEYEQRDEAVRGDADTQKKFHSFVLFLGELYLHLEVKYPDGAALRNVTQTSAKFEMTHVVFSQVKSAKGAPTRANILLTGLKDLMISLFSKPVDGNLICAVKLLKLTGSVLDDAWSERGQSHMEELIQRIETILLDATCSRDVRQMLLKLVELRSSDWGRVRSAAAASNATPENDPNYFMNEPTFYTEDGTPFTAADPEYAEKYQEILDRQDYFHDVDGENGNDVYDFEDEMGPEIEEAYESFCLESEKKRQQ